jgi:outer membrane lipoprotein-sorting protein
VLTPGAAGRRALSVGLALALWGCTFGGGRAQRIPISPFLSRAPTVGEVVAALRSREEAVASFRGQARLDYSGPDGTAKSSQMILVKAPDLVRIDVMSPFGPTYTVASDGQYLRAYDRGSKVMYVGAVSPANLRTYTRVSLGVAVLARLIRGLPPSSMHEATTAAVSANPDGWLWQADLADGGRVRMDLDKASLRPVRAELVDPALGGTVVVEFDRYGDVDGVALAHRVRARLVDGSAVELQYARIWRSITVTESVFRLDAPPGVRIVDMRTEAPSGSPL